MTNGFLDDVEVSSLREWERGFHEFMGAQFPQVGERLRSEKVLSKEIEADLKRAIDEYKKVSISAAPTFKAANL